MLCWGSSLMNSPMLKALGVDGESREQDFKSGRVSSSRVACVLAYSLKSPRCRKVRNSVSGELDIDWAAEKCQCEPFDVPDRVSLSAWPSILGS
jgi:hypothetical protein